MQPSSSRARSRSWGSGPWTTTPPLSPRQTKPRHERSRSTTATYPPLVVSQSQVPLCLLLLSDANGLHGSCSCSKRVNVTDSSSQQQQGEAGGDDADGSSVTEEQEVVVVVAQPEDGVGPTTTATHMEDSPRVSDGGAAKDKERVRHLEREAASAKQREMKMLESLVQQTKELEQAKIALEEARLEVAALRQQQGADPAAAQATQTQTPQQQWSVMDLMFGGVDEEINGLRARLRASAQAEERSRKAADELTAALSAVTMEAKQVKAWLADAQTEAEAARAESDRLRGLLQGAEAELWCATERVGALTADWKDAAAGWRAREKALLARARAAEEDARESAAARRALGDDNAVLRRALRALERAAEDANAAAEALEAATADTAALQEAVAEKERELEALRRENEDLKASEAAARERAEELERQVAAARKERETIPLVEKWRREDAQAGNKLSAAAFLDTGRLAVPAGGGRKDRMFASLSNLAELKSAAAAAAALDDDDYGYEFDHLDVAGQYGDAANAMKQHKMKRRSILRKFGDLFRRRSLYKSNLAPVLTTTRSLRRTF